MRLLHYFSYIIVFCALLQMGPKTKVSNIAAVSKRISSSYCISLLHIPYPLFFGIFVKSFIKMHYSEVDVNFWHPAAYDYKMFLKGVSQGI